MNKETAIKILRQQRVFWSYDGPIDKTPPPVLRKDLVNALDIAIENLTKEEE